MTQKKAHSEEGLFEQAKSYALRFKEVKIERLHSLTTQRDGYIVESFYFNQPQKFINHKAFDISPFQQFTDILKKNPSISYLNARSLIKFSMINYFAADCDSVRSFFKQLDGYELVYNKDHYSLGFDSPSYTYIYTDKKLPVTQNITTAIEEHPVTRLNQNAHEAIKNCSYPKEPPSL